MRARTGLLWVVMAMLVSAAGIGHAQDLPDTRIPLLGKKYKPPAFLKRGFTAIYQATGGVGDKPAGLSWQIYVVDYVDNTQAAGLMYTISPALGRVTAQTWCSPGGAGNFYWSPEFLRDSAAHPDKGVTITQHTMTYEHDNDKISMVFTDAGLLTGMHSVQWRGAKKNTSVLQYKAHTIIPRPEVVPKEFPPQAKVAHQYMQSTSMGMQRVPTANLKVGLAKVEGGVAHYKIASQMAGTGMPMPAQTTYQYGTTAWGPFYMHPDYLKTMQRGTVIMEFPQLQFKNVVTAVQDGKVRIDTILSNNTVAYDVYDIQTGLLVVRVEHVAAQAYLITQLVR